MVLCDACDTEYQTGKIESIQHKLIDLNVCNDCFAAIFDTMKNNHDCDLHSVKKRNVHVCKICDEIL